ncbi:MAG: hypothetical protein IKA31_05015 [Clostridia bacterium]|nr:hypothetical protein [Clostridia bacterium]
MKSLIKSFDGLPKLVKLILALPMLDIVWAVYRLIRSINKGNVLGIVLGIVMLVACPAILWILDLITILLTDKVLWID